MDWEQQHHAESGALRSIRGTQSRALANFYLNSGVPGTKASNAAQNCAR